MNKAELLRELVRDEDLKLHAYPDSEGFWTIGIGRLIDKRRGGKITKEEALYLAGHDIDDVEADLDRALPWWRKMSERRQRALANMCFNLGLPRLLEFKKTLVHLEAGRYHGGSDRDAGLEVVEAGRRARPAARRDDPGGMMRASGRATRLLKRRLQGGALLDIGASHLEQALCLLWGKLGNQVMRNDTKVIRITGAINGVADAFYLGEEVFPATQYERHDRLRTHHVTPFRRDDTAPAPLPC